MQQLPPNFTRRSYTDRAVIVMVMYLFFWLPGLVANIIWLTEALNYQSQTGIKPIGTTALWVLLILFGVGWLIIILILIVSLSAAFSTIRGG